MAPLLNYGKTLLPAATITVAGTFATDPISLGQISDTSAVLAAQATFVYGSGGTTCKSWVQTSLDGGLTWIDIASFAFTTVTATKVSVLSLYIATAAALTPTDGSLADNTILNGLLGDRVRCKLTTTGTYGGNTTLALAMVTRG